VKLPLLFKPVLPRIEAAAGRAGLPGAGASSKPRPPLLAVAAGALVLVASRANYLNHNAYPLLTPEAGLVAAALIVAAAAAGFVYAASGPLGRTLLEVLLCYLAFDLNFDGMGVVAATLIAALALNRVLVPMLGIVAFVVLVTEIFAPFGSGMIEARTGPAPAANPAARNPDAPPLLHLVLDEHIGLEGLPGHLPEASKMRRELARFYSESGFRLFGGAYSEHLHTVNAIPHILNFGAAQPWRPGRKDGLAVEENAYFERLGELGYDLRLYQTDFVDYCAHPAVRSCKEYRAADLGPIAASALPAKDKAALVLYGFLSLSEATTAAGGLYDLVAWRVRSYAVDLPMLLLDSRRRTSSAGALVAFDRLIADLQHAQPGEAYFAHLLLPHYPYATDRDCALKSPGSWQMRRSPMASWEERQLAYMDQLRCVTLKVALALEALAASPAGSRSIVIVHGDHGSRITTEDPGIETMDRLRDDDLVASYSTLLAVRAAGIEAGYDASRVPVARLLAALAGSGFRSASVELGADFVPSIVLEDLNWKPSRRHDLPDSWVNP